MNFLEYMSFDPSWFTSLPGILITLGVVVLLIALIVLLAGGKDKKENENIDEKVTDEGVSNDIVTPAAVEQTAMATEQVLQPEQASIEVPTPDVTIPNPQDAQQVQIPEPNVL